MENFLMGLSTTGLGMLVVFLGLVFLMYIMIGLASVNRMGARKDAAPKASLPAQAAPQAEAVPPQAVILPVEAPAAAAPSSDRAAEEVAAIAAVLAILTAEGVQGTVTAVRRLGGNAATWVLAGRRDIMASRL